MDAKKIAALKAMGIPQAVIDELLAEVLATEKQADAQHVRYKEKPMGANPDYDTLEHLYDVVDRVKDRRGILAAVGVAAVAVRAAIDAEAGRVTLKEGRLVYKASDLAALLDQAVAAAGRPLVERALQQLAGQGAPGRTTLSDSGPMSAQKSYDAATDPWAAAWGADQTRRQP